MVTTARKGAMTPDPEVESAAPPVDDVVEAVAEEAPAEDVVDDDEELDPSTPLFDGGPNLGQIEMWKQQFGDVYVTSFGADEHYVWRTMSRHEYRRLVKQLEQQVATGQIGQAEANMNNEEAICELCLLYPALSRPDMARIPAGVAAIVSQEVMEASSFVALEVRQL